MRSPKWMGATSLGAWLALFLTTGAARSQDPQQPPSQESKPSQEPQAPQDATAPAPPTAAPPADPPPAPAPPPPAPKPTPATAPTSWDDVAPEPKPPTLTDHESVVRRLGIGFLGVSDLPIAEAEPTGTKSNPGLAPNGAVLIRRVAAPVIGARIWLGKRVGIEPGVGFSYSGGSTSSELGKVEVDVDKQSVLGFLVHMGVPIMIADTRHMALVLVPAVDFGMARSSVEPVFEANAPPPATLTGTRLDIGARAGAEIHFGFMGLPNLALEGSVGLVFAMEWASASIEDQSISDVSARLTTTAFHDPWDIFGGIANVAARYYF